MNEIKERPILFSGPMVRAILEGRKTVTRRVMKPQPTKSGPYSENYARWRYIWLWDIESWGDGEIPPRSLVERCPHGKPGDSLWVKESWWAWGHFEETGRVTESGKPEKEFVWDGDRETMAYLDDYPIRSDIPRPFRMTPDKRDKWHKRPSIFMPHWASRITLEITGVRVERVQDISEVDAIAEGLAQKQRDNGAIVYQVPGRDIWYRDPRLSFERLWQSINGKRPGCSWNDNPWAWVISFQRLT